MRPFTRNNISLFREFYLKSLVFKTQDWNLTLIFHISENLSCDGELPAHEVQFKARFLNEAKAILNNL
jgi:hypothetical protein